MKAARTVLQIAALVLTVAAAVCVVIAFWDKIEECVGSVVNRFHARRQYAEGCCIADPDDDYSDWDE